MSDDTSNAGRKRPMGIMLISMLHILAGVFIFAYLLFTLIKFSDVFFLDTQPIILLTLGGAMVLMAICLLISSYGLWKLKTWGRRFVIGFHIILIPASTQGLGISAFVDAILIIINDGKTNNLLPYNNIISAIISALIIAYLFRKKIREKFS